MVIGSKPEAADYLLAERIASAMDMQTDYGYTHPFTSYSFANGVLTPEQAAQQMTLFSYQPPVDHIQPVSSASTVAAVAAGMTLDAPLPVVSGPDSGGESDDFSPESPMVDHSLMDAAMRELADATGVEDMSHDALQAATESSLDAGNHDPDGK